MEIAKNKNNFMDYCEEKKFCDDVCDNDSINTKNVNGGANVESHEIKERFDFVGNILKDHGEKINEYGERINEVEWGLKHLIKNQENFSGELKTVNTNLMSYHNNVLGSLNNLLMNKQDNDTKVTTAKIDSKSKIYVQLMILFGCIVGSGTTVYIAMK